MSEITAIGLGLMGSALARAIHRAGHDLTVWNRSPEKMKPFIDDGIAAASDAASAISASPVILICIDNYQATSQMLADDAVLPHLPGRTVVQLSTGTPGEAIQAAEWMAQHNVSYLDGAILGGPPGIGTDAAQILLSGNAEAHEKAGRLLACLAGSVRYLGAEVKMASVLDLAWLCNWYGQFVAIAHAANLCRSEGARMDDLVSVFANQPFAHYLARVIRDESFDQCTATLQVWADALKQIEQQGVDANIDTQFPDFVASLFKKAIASGYGQENVMSLYKVLQADGR